MFVSYDCDNFLYDWITAFLLNILSYLFHSHAPCMYNEAPADYETVTRTLTFTNSTEQIVSVPIIADDRTENTESFTALLTNPTPPGSAFITTSTATINIIDQQGS